MFRVIDDQVKSGLVQPGISVTIRFGSDPTKLK
jgi:hypothetical protein